MRRSIGWSPSDSFQWRRWRTRNFGPPKRQCSTRNAPVSTLSPAAKCTGARTTVIRLRTPCSIISGKRSPPFRGAGRSRSRHTIRTSIIRRRLAEANYGHIDLGLVDEFRLVSSHTDKPIKITMTGPHMLAKVAYDEHYNDIHKMMGDFGKLLRHNFKLLADAGCKHIQIDEPLFTMSDYGEVKSASTRSIWRWIAYSTTIHTSTHVCQGNYAVGKEYDGQIGHRYFE